MRLSFPRRFTVSMALGLGIAACGGGGGGGPPPPTPTYTVGGAVAGLAAGESVTLTNNGSDTVAVTSNTTFVFATSVEQNGTYAVAVKTQPPAQHCTVSAGSGSAVMANVTTVAVTCANLAQYAYVVNNGDNTISQYSIDASGTLAPLSVPTIAIVATSSLPQSITVDPSNRYVFVTTLGGGAGAVWQYVIQSDGTLALNAPEGVLTGNGPWAVAVSPSGNFAYVANSVDNTISIFSLTAAGVLVPTALSPVPTGSTPWNVTLSPDGKYLYVANHGTQSAGGMTISQYVVDATTGALASLNPSTVATAYPYPGGITVDPTSSYAYLSNINGNSLSEFAIGTDGTLSSLNPPSVATGSEPVFLAFDPTGKYAYEANYTVDVSAAVGTVSQYTVGTGGQLTPMTPATVQAGTGPGWIAFDALGKYAYVSNLGNGTTVPGSVSEYAIGAGGALTLIGTAPAGLNAFMIATALPPQ